MSTYHPVEIYTQRLREYQWESLMLYRARSEGWSDATVQGAMNGVLTALDRLWQAQGALRAYVLSQIPANLLIDEAIRRQHGLTRGLTRGLPPIKDDV